MEFTKTGYATGRPAALLVPTIGAAGENSVRVRMDGHTQFAPITGSVAGVAGLTTGHRPWSPLIT